MKTKTITVSPGWTIGDKPFRVEKITDSTEFMPNDMLSKDTVDHLCAKRDWKVTIVRAPS